MSSARRHCHRFLALAPSLLLFSCMSVFPKHDPIPGAPGYEVSSQQRGIASWYSVRTNRGTHTASGQRLQDHSATAAHRTLPFGTKVRVTNELNGRSIIVTINNRGPHIRGRIIDVTIGSAEKLGFRQRGLAPVTVEVLKPIDKS